MHDKLLIDCKKLVCEWSVFFMITIIMSYTYVSVLFGTDNDVELLFPMKFND